MFQKGMWKALVAYCMDYFPSKNEAAPLMDDDPVP
jgi:hypothetical protein